MSSNRSGPKIILCILALLMIVPNLALAAVATDQATSVATSSRVSSRAPEACPNSAAGWTISGTHNYTGTCTISGGAITVSASADITFEKVTLTHSGSYYLVVNGILRILNSTINGASSWEGIYGNTGSPLIKIENSTVKGFTAIGVRVYTGSRAEIGNSTFDAGSNCWYGIYVYQATGGFVTHNKVNNVVSYGMEFSQSSSVNVDNNTVVMNLGGNHGVKMDGFSGRFDNNTIKGGDMGVLTIINQAPSSFWNNKIYGGTVGLYLIAATLNASFCNFWGNSGSDVALTSNAKMKAYDTALTTSTLVVGTSLEVYWRANFTVEWLSNGQGVQGAALNITDANKNKDPRNPVTDNVGVVKNLYLMEYFKDSTGKKLSSPYIFNASINTGGKSYSNYTKGSIANAVNNFTIILDDVPPPLTLAQPTGGLMTNRPWAIVKAWTERNISINWPITAKVQVDSKVYIPIVGPDGYIEQNVTLPSDGEHTISVKVIDSDLNSKMIIINVTRDTVPPVLAVTSPIDGTLTNVTTIDVKGSTEPIANLTVNGAIVPVQAAGTFTYKYHLVEGDNVITVKSEDKVHNMVKKVLKVKLDTKTPDLSIIQPMNGYKTNQSVLSIQGTTEAEATLTINDVAVLLSGTSFQMNYNLTEGVNILQIKSCDAAGNCNLTSLRVTLKTKLPSLTITSPKDGYLTNQEKLTLQGTTDEGSIVTINDDPVTFLGTSFSYDLNLSEGENIFKVDSVDDVGNKAELVITVYLDTVPPALTINSPKDGTIVNTPKVTIDGSTEQKAVVTVNGEAVPNSNGAFTTKVVLTEGMNYINVTAMDQAGNKATARVKVILDTKVSVKVTGLTTGTALETTNMTYELTGTADPDASVYVNDHPVTIDKNGNFKTVVQLSLGKNNITVRAEDRPGNKVSYSYQILRKAPQKPPIIPTTNNGPLGGLLVPILVIVALVAAVGVGAGLYMRKRGRAKDAQTSPVQASVAPTTQTPPMAPMTQQTRPESQLEVGQEGRRT